MSDVEWAETVVVFIVGKEVGTAGLDCFCRGNGAGFSGQLSTLSRARFSAWLLLITYYSDPR